MITVWRMPVVATVEQVIKDIKEGVATAHKEKAKKEN